MRDHSHIDDLQLQHGQADDSWVAGELELTEERPTTALRSDPHQRKWMLIGIGGCGLLTAIATVLTMMSGADETHAAAPAPIEPAPIEQPIEPAPVVEPAPVEPAPEASKPKSREKHTLASTSRAAASGPAPIKKAPPAPAAAQPIAPAAKPAAPNSTPAANPTAAPAPAPTPVLPAEQPSDDAPAHDLPDVEAWDDADAAVEDDQPAAEPS